jgi:hypothetical protein
MAKSNSYLAANDVDWTDPNAVGNLAEELQLRIKELEDAIIAAIYEEDSTAADDILRAAVNTQTQINKT